MSIPPCHVGDWNSIPQRGVLNVLGGFPSSSSGKEYACNAGDPGSIPGLGRSPGEGREWLPTPVFWPGEFHGLYSPWGRKELEMTEQLSLSFFL